MKFAAKFRSALLAKVQFKKLLFAASAYLLSGWAVFAKLAHHDTTPRNPNEPSHLFLITFGFLIFFIVYQLPITRKLTHFRPN